MTKSISQLPAAAAVADTDEIELNQAGVSRKGTRAQLLASAAPLVHAHAIGDVTGLQAALDGKADSSHQHLLADVTDAGQLAAKDAIDDAALVQDGVLPPQKLSGAPAAGYVLGSGSAGAGIVFLELVGAVVGPESITIQPVDPDNVVVGTWRHRLAATERVVVVDNGDVDCVVVVPEGLAKGAWLVDGGTDGTIVVIAAEGASWAEPVKDRGLTAPPGSPATGDRYIVAGPATGAWTDHEDDLTEWDGAAWQFTAPVDGTTTWVADELKKYVYNASPGEWASTNGTAMVNGKGHVPLKGDGRAATVWVRSNPTALAPAVRVEGETLEGVAAPGEAVATPTISAGTLTLDVGEATVFEVALTENVTTLAFTGWPPAGIEKTAKLKIVQDSTPRTFAFTGVLWGGGAAPSVSTGSGQEDVYAFTSSDGGATIYGYAGPQDFA